MKGPEPVHRLFIALLALLLVAAAASPSKIYDDALALARKELPDGAWSKVALKPRPILGAQATPGETTSAVNATLAALGPAKALLLSPDDQEYWALQSFFSGDIEGFRFRQTGAWFERRGRRWFVRNALAGSPAADAGLKRGDEILLVDGKPLAPVQSFASLRPHDTAKITYKRLAWDKPATLALGTRVESIQESLLRAMQVSRHVYDFDKLKIAYVWLPAATHPAFKRELEKAAESFARDADALVLDLRDGFGGSDLTYLEPFFDGAQKAIFNKPLVALVDGNTRSGKEWLAWILKRRGRAQLVGETTAGSFRAGKVVPMEAGSYLLYVEVGDHPRVATDLPEGKGIAPDIAVERGLMYAAAADEPLAAALKAALQAAKRS